jgi:hypothetical protein
MQILLIALYVVLASTYGLAKPGTPSIVDPLALTSAALFALLTIPNTILVIKEIANASRTKHYAYIQYLLFACVVLIWIAYLIALQRDNGGV